MNDLEIIDDRFRSMILPNAALETLGEGYRWLEGPVWFADQDCLYVSDIPNNRILRWSEHGGVNVFRCPSGFAMDMRVTCKGACLVARIMIAA